MNILKFLKAEFSGWEKYERILFPSVILLIVCISFVTGDNKIALVSAVCGISYTILAGKGKISCYFCGLCGTLCYSYLAFKNALYGNLLLYLGYYLPMQTLGIFLWRKHLNKETHEIIKTRLSTKARVLYSFAAITGTVILFFVLQKLGDATPFLDAVTTIFSVAGLILTLKRCVEQWYAWLIVNGLSVIMWTKAYINGSNCLATILMWAVYFVLGIYFLYIWKRELSGSIKKDPR